MSHLRYIQLENLARNFSLTLVQELVDGLEKKVSTGDDLYGGDLEVIAKIMVGAIAFTERNGEMNFTDVDRILEVSLRSNNECH